MCGIVGIYSKNFNNNLFLKLLLNSIYSLRNRGRNGYGLLIIDNNLDKIIEKNNSIIDIEEIYSKIYSNLKKNTKFKVGLGHTRYSTDYGKDKNSKNNKNNPHHLQPLKGYHNNLGEFFIIHNGQINFKKEFIKKISENLNLNIELFSKLNDSGILVKYIESLKSYDWNLLLKQLINEIPGAFNIILYTNKGLYCLKDKFGVRPLCIGENNGNYIACSESKIFNEYNFRLLLEVEPGQIINIYNDNLTYYNIVNESLKNHCLFEFFYFMNSNSSIKLKNSELLVSRIRKNLGKTIAKNENNISKYSEFSKDNIVVVGSPMSGIDCALGFAEYLKLNYIQFIEKNKNTDRSFIMDNNEERRKECKKKFKIIENFNLKNKILYFFDDSIVRGNTIENMINIFKSLKPLEIHIRISSPMIKNVCYFGIDIPTKEELLFNRTNTNDFCKKYNINSIKFMEIQEIKDSISKDIMYTDADKDNFCEGCFSGSYNNKLFDW